VLKPFAMIFFVLVMVWIGAILVTSNPSSRIDRACFPIALLDRVVVATVQLLHEPWAADAHHYMRSFEYGCQFTIWKTFYEESGTSKPTQEGTKPVASTAAQKAKAGTASAPRSTDAVKSAGPEADASKPTGQTSAAPRTLEEPEKRAEEPKPAAPSSYFDEKK
jgi:hypothetical protein